MLYIDWIAYSVYTYVGIFQNAKEKKKVEQKFNLGQSDKTLRGVKI
jgi:hypothetical protein